MCVFKFFFKETHFHKEGTHIYELQLITFWLILTQCHEFFLLDNYNNKNIPIPCGKGKNDGRVISIEWNKLDTDAHDSMSMCEVQIKPLMTLTSQ